MYYVNEDIKNCVRVGEWVMALGDVINRATMLNPFVMGIVVSVMAKSSRRAWKKAIGTFRK